MWLAARFQLNVERFAQKRGRGIAVQSKPASKLLIIGK